MLLRLAVGRYEWQMDEEESQLSRSPLLDAGPSVRRLLSAEYSES